MCYNHFMNKRRLILLSIALLSLMYFVFREPSVPIRTPLSAGATVLAFGDSLTYGTGALRHESYPAVLARISSLNVINKGIPGELSSEGLKRLADLLREHKPELVIICHGGNDILRQRSHEELRSNLKKMVKTAQNKGVEVLLVGVPDFRMLGFRTLPLYAEVAEETGVLYEGDIISDIISDNRLKSDRIHPNAEGYTMMAEAFLEVLNEGGVITRQ